MIEMMGDVKISEGQCQSLRMKSCFLPSAVTSTSKTDKTYIRIQNLIIMISKVFKRKKQLAFDFILIYSVQSSLVCVVR